jgi:uncharacterized protein (DUF1330 family)
MSAYLIACVQWHDPDATAAYGKLVVDSMQPYGGKYLARGAPVAALEGDQAPKRLAIVEFPSVAQARQWHASPEYAPIRKIREEHATTFWIIIMDQVPPS